MRKLSTTVILALVGILPANAQYSFTIDGGFSGDCARVSGVRELNQQLKAIKGEVISGFPDPTSCEQARAMVNGIKAQAEMITYDARTGKTIDRKKYNCHFSLSASPCTGRPLSGGTIGTPNIKGVSEGTSFYSVNGAEEIQNWSQDEAMRRMGLDNNYNSDESTNVLTGDLYFDAARNKLSGRMPDGSTKYIMNTDLLKVVNLANRTPGVFTLSSNAMPITMIQPESGVYSPPIHDAYAEMKRIEEERRQRQLELEQKEMKIWDEIKSKLDDVNYAQLCYILQYNNGDERPKFLGITDSGRYIFESTDGNNVFSVSKDAHDIQTLTFEEHSWNDENIIRAIQEKSFKEVIDDRFEFEFKGGKLDFLDTKDGKITFGDLDNFSPDKLRQLLPYIKGEIKLKLFDNSNKWSYEYTHLTDNHLSYGGTVDVQSGLKDNISASIKVDATGEKSELSSDGKPYFSGSTSTVKDGISLGPKKIKGNAAAEIEVASAKIMGKGGYTQKMGDNFFYCSGGIELKGGIKIDKKVLLMPSLKSIFYTKGKIGGVQCKNITKYSRNITTLRK